MVRVEPFGVTVRRAAAVPLRGRRVCRESRLRLDRRANRRRAEITGEPLRRRPRDEDLPSLRPDDYMAEKVGPQLVEREVLFDRLPQTPGRLAGGRAA